MGAFFGEEIKPRVSRAKKEARSFARQMEIMDYIDLYFGEIRDENEFRRYDINYGLFNGDLDVNLYEDPICFNIGGEKVKLEHQSIVHYPIISQVARAMHGELMSRPFQPTAKDLGSFAQTAKNNKWNELLRELIQQDILMPMEQEITSEYYRNNNIQDIFGLSPEEQQQVQADIQGRIQARTPEDIINFMENDYQTPTQRQAQQLLDYYISHLGINSIQQEGFKHAIITGQEYYYIGERYGEPVFEFVNPKYLRYDTGSQNEVWCNKGDWAKYEQWFSFPKITQRHAEKLNKAHWAELEEYIEPIGGFTHVGDPRKDRVMERTMYELSTDSLIAEEFGDINIKTKKGQNDMKRVYERVIEKYGMNYGHAFSNYGIRECHMVWRDKRKLNKVTRVERGKEVVRYFDEHYESKPEDIRVVEVWVDEVWEGTKIGNHDECLYLNIQPIPGQYKSIFNPYQVQLPYVGRKYNTQMNNAPNVAPIDLGKPSQMEFDTLMAQLKHDLQTDVGSVFLMVLDLKPDGMNWQDWMNTMRNGKLLMTNLNKRGLHNFDPNMLKSVDMNRTADIAAKAQLLEMFKQNIFSEMYFNPARVGAIGQYATDKNIETNQSASYNQTEEFFDIHRQIVEVALNIFMNRAKLIFKDKPFKSSHILGDPERIDLEISSDFWYEEVGIEFKISSEELRRVEELRARMLEFIQNGMSYSGIFALATAKTMNDIQNLLKNEEKKIEKKMQEERQLQLEEMEKQRQAEMAEKQSQREHEIQQSREQYASQEARAIIDSETLRKGEDVNRNNESDLKESKEIELRSKERIEREKLVRKDRELDLKEKDIEVKSKQAKTKTR